LLAEARHRRLRGRPVERQDAAVHRLIGGSGYRLGYAGCHSQRLVLRRPLGDRDGQHASDCRLPGAGRLPPLREVVPHIVRGETPADIDRPGPDRVRTLDRNPRNVGCQADGEDGLVTSPQ
jgi:hypothetical protein